MGTQGKFGFLYKGKLYMRYNHEDSEPDCLGVHLLLEILHANLDDWIKLLENIKEVPHGVEPTQEDIEKLKKYTCLEVSQGSTKEWYCLLRYTQGSFYHVLNSGYLENVKGDVYDEYTYVLDLDNMVFKAKGDDLDEVEIKLEKEVLMKYAKEWSKGHLDEEYDPEKQLMKTKERFEMPGKLAAEAMQKWRENSGN